MAIAQPIDSLSDADIPTGADVSLAPKPVQTVIEAMIRAGIPYSLLELPANARSVDEIAAFCGCDINFLARTVVMRGKTTKKPFMLMHSAASRVSEKHIGSLVGENLQHADADFVQRYTSFSADHVPPMPHINRLPVMIDDQLLRFARIFVPAGAPGYIISVPAMVLARSTSARVIHTFP